MDCGPFEHQLRSEVADLSAEYIAVSHLHASAFKYRRARVQQLERDSLPIRWPMRVIVRAIAIRTIATSAMLLIKASLPAVAAINKRTPVFNAEQKARRRQKIVRFLQPPCLFPVEHDVFRTGGTK